LRSDAEAVLQMFSKGDVEGPIGAGRQVRSGDRLNYRNDFRERALDTRLGALQPRIPQLWLAFLQPDQASARRSWRHVADQLRPRWPERGRLMDDSGDGVLGYIAVPTRHRTRLHPTNPLERLNKEVKRRANVIIFRSDASIIRRIGAVLLEADDEWQMQHRCMGVEAMGEMLNPATTKETRQLPPKAA
jgi:transposase-like protein